MSDSVNMDSVERLVEKILSHVINEETITALEFMCAAHHVTELLRRNAVDTSEQGMAITDPIMGVKIERPEDGN